TIEQNLTNPTLLARVVRSEGLAQDKSSSATGQTEPSQAANKSQNASGVTTFTPLEEALGRAMVGMVHPAIRRGTRLIDLYVTNGNPAMAQRLAEAVGREYIRNSLESAATQRPDASRPASEAHRNRGRRDSDRDLRAAAVRDRRERTRHRVRGDGRDAARRHQPDHRARRVPRPHIRGQ